MTLKVFFDEAVWDEAKKVFNMSDDDVAEAKRRYVDFHAFFTRALESGWRREKSTSAYAEQFTP